MKHYISISKKFKLTLCLTILWTIICSIIEIPWWHSLDDRFGSILATLIVLFLATFPGIMEMLMICGILLDKPRRRPVNPDELEDITVLVAAYNEQDGIYDTIKSLAQQQYPKHMYVKVIDNNSKDNTKQEILRGIKDFPNLDCEYMFEERQGKFMALNTGLATVATKYVLTIDADTYLYKDAILYLANAICTESKNKKVGAIAGTVLVRNSRVNLLTKMQEWEYFLCISGIKRSQGLFQTTLVAQGAFSIYNTEAVRSVGGWPDDIGEDILVTWKLLEKGYCTYYEDLAISFTNAPTSYKIFARQRSRWARGLASALKKISLTHTGNKYAKFFIYSDFLLFAIDFGIVFFYTPGVIAALLFHDYAIIGPLNMLLYPITILIFLLLHEVERKRVFKQLGLKIRRHYGALFVMSLIYSIIMAPTCIRGYYQELVGTTRKWK